MDRIIVDSRENRSRRRSLYNQVTQSDGLASQMMQQIKKLEKAEPFIEIDAQKAIRRNPWIVGVGTAVVTAVITVVLREVLPLFPG